MVVHSTTPPPGSRPGAIASALDRVTNWSRTLKEAEALVMERTEIPTSEIPALVGEYLVDLHSNVMQMLGPDHPLVNAVNKYCYIPENRLIRPLVVMLIAKATSLAPKRTPVSDHEHREEMHVPAVTETTTNDEECGVIALAIHDKPADKWTRKEKKKKQQQNKVEEKTMTEEKEKVEVDGTDILPSQRRLAVAVEMIHTATMHHGDAVDFAEARRKPSSINTMPGNEMSTMASDVALTRALTEMSEIGNPQVTRLVSTMVGDMIEGEMMQLRNTQDEDESHLDKFGYYMERTYMKTASLISKSCQASATLGGATDEVCEMAYNYGMNVGMALQLADDMREFVATETGTDLELDLATAPVLFASQEYPDLEVLVRRKCSQAGDMARAREWVMQSQALSRTYQLAHRHREKAVEAISRLPESKARTALIELTDHILQLKT
ncbi:coq1 putative hexaprenyl diphosphate synthase [Dissophora globulifera]|nr:coq1 putative hexaprenyl diphosphate synthase [Dissophora globulifera]